MSNDIKLRYLESLDSVRFLHGENIDGGMKHAEIELMLSILFGEPIVIPEPYSCVSLGFLDIAPEILNTIGGHKFKTSRSPVSKPFKLALRSDIPGHSSYREMISTFLKDKDFYLPWPEINRDMKTRKRLAKCIIEKKYDEATQYFDSEEDKKRITNLDNLDSYFSDNNNLCNAKTLETLDSYANWITKISDKDIDNLEIDYNKDYIKDLVKEIEKLGIYERRSIYRTIIEEREGILNPDITKGILVCIDSCYNNIVAKSVQAGSRVITTKEYANNPYIEAGEILASLAISKLDNTVIHWSSVSLWLDPDYIKLSSSQFDR